MDNYIVVIDTEDERFETNKMSLEEARIYIERISIEVGDFHTFDNLNSEANCDSYIETTVRVEDVKSISILKDEDFEDEED